MTVFNVSNGYDLNIVYKLANPYGTADGRKQSFGYRQRQRMAELEVLVKSPVYNEAVRVAKLKQRLTKQVIKAAIKGKKIRKA